MARLSLWNLSLILKEQIEYKSNGMNNHCTLHFLVPYWRIQNIKNTIYKRLLCAQSMELKYIDNQILK